MSEEEYHSQPENEGEQSEGEPKPRKSDEEINANHQVFLAGQQQAKDKEELYKQSNRKEYLYLCLVENKCYGFEPAENFDPLDHPEAVEKLSILLDEEESKYRSKLPDFDITTSWSDEDIRVFFERKYKNVSDEKIADDRQDERSAYDKAYEKINEDHPNGLDNLSLCKKLLENSNQIPESEISKIQGFIAMKDLAATPEDQAIVTAKINALDFSNGVSDPVLFLQSSIFSDPAISEASKDAMAQHFKVTRFKTNTGTQVDKAMDAVNEAGEPLHGENNPLQRDGVEIYVKPPDMTRIARVEIDGIGTREIPWKRGMDGVTIGLKMSLIKLYSLFEVGGNTDFFGETVNMETNILSQTDPKKLRKTQLLMEAILGGNAGYNGEIITSEQAKFIIWFNQFTSTKGDAIEGDADETTADENRTNLGFHPNGNSDELDFEVLSAAGSFASGQYGSGEPDYYALQKHLHGLFPNKVPLTGKNAEDKDA